MLKALVREEIERAGATGSRAGAALVPPPPPSGPLVLVAGSGMPDAVKFVAAELSAAGGFRTETELYYSFDEQRVRGAASARAARAVVYLTASTLGRRPVRGTREIASHCQIGMRVITASAPAGPEDILLFHGFGGRDDAAQEDCLRRGAPEMARRAHAVIRPTGAALAATQFVLLVLDIADPGPLPRVLAALRSMASVSGSEVRKLAPGRAEIRVFTRLAPAALSAGLAAALGTVARLDQLEAAGNRLLVQVQLAPPPDEGAGVSGAP
jgi:hypothetical protein